MKKYTAAIRHLKNTIKELAACKRASLGQLQGRELHAARMTYNWFDRPKVRAALLAYGLLREIPYERMEGKCEVPPPAHLVLKHIHEALDPELKAEWSQDRVCALLQPTAKKEAA